VYLDLADAIARDGKAAIEARYGNLLQMYERITGQDPRLTPMRIYPAPHYTMGGLWVDYHLMSTVPGLFVLGEANFSEHGANRLGASALMQGLADGYFIAPATITAWLAGQPQPEVGPDHPACCQARAEAGARIAALLAPRGGLRAPRPVDCWHRQLGQLMIDACGISRHGPRLQQAIAQVEDLRQAFAEEGGVADSGASAEPAAAGAGRGINTELEKALRLQDYFGLADLMLRDALARQESCGAHFRQEYQSAAGEAQRDDVRFGHIAAWQWRPQGAPQRHVEPLQFNEITPSQRDYR
jgi:succinate dehydrogenase / fumarate reductase flavoprotein subunit